MKNKKIFIGIGIFLILILSISIFVIMKKNSSSESEYHKELEEKDKKVLIEMAYTNWAFGFSYDGKAIFNDGTIYHWNFRGSVNDYDSTSTLTESKDWILGHSEKNIQKMPEEDLKKLENYIENLEDKIERIHAAVDAGSNYIAVWDYEKNNKIIIKEDGDYTGENQTEYAQKIISLANEYLK